MFPNLSEKNSYPFPDDTYWHGKCKTCEVSYAGPKRAVECYPCSLRGEQLVFDFASI